MEKPVMDSKQCCFVFVLFLGSVNPNMYDTILLAKKKKSKSAFIHLPCAGFGWNFWLRFSFFKPRQHQEEKPHELESFHTAETNFHQCFCPYVLMLFLFFTNLQRLIFIISLNYLNGQKNRLSACPSFHSQLKQHPQDIFSKYKSNNILNIYLEMTTVKPDRKVPAHTFWQEQN